MLSTKPSLAIEAEKLRRVEEELAQAEMVGQRLAQKSARQDARAQAKAEAPEVKAAQAEARDGGGVGIVGTSHSSRFKAKSDQVRDAALQAIAVTQSWWRYQTEGICCRIAFIFQLTSANYAEYRRLPLKQLSPVLDRLYNFQVSPHVL